MHVLPPSLPIYLPPHPSVNVVFWVGDDYREIDCKDNCNLLISSCIHTHESVFLPRSDVYTLPPLTYIHTYIPGAKRGICLYEEGCKNSFLVLHSLLPKPPLPSLSSSPLFLSSAAAAFSFAFLFLFRLAISSFLCK